MKDELIDTIYNGERYRVPYSKMMGWLAYMEELSIFRRDAGHLEIAFHDSFHRYRVEGDLEIQMFPIH